MASVWIEKRRVSDGTTRYRVRYRLGGSESIPKFGGSFKTKRDASAAAAGSGRAGGDAGPRHRGARAASPSRRRLPSSPSGGAQSRVDVAGRHRRHPQVNLGRSFRGSAPARSTRSRRQMSPRSSPTLNSGGLKRETIRKTLSTLAMVLDFAKVVPNPARDPTSSCPARTGGTGTADRRARAAVLSGRSPTPTGCRCLCSTRPGCGSANSRR